MKTEYQHSSVLTEEVIDYLKPLPGQNFIDATLGGGGHSAHILKANKPDGKVLAFEIDPHAVVASQVRLAPYQDRVIMVSQSYVHLKEVWSKYKKILKKVSGIVIDLGLSSDQLDRANRGFSFKDDGPLDMRFDTKQSLTASDIILTWSEQELTNMFRKYGEIPKAERLSHGLVTWRQTLAPQDFFKQKQNILKTSVFVSAILRISYIKESDLFKFKRHPATLIFQALRLAVNHELENLQKFLPQAMEILESGGRLVVISFHSLEDRIVKDFFKGRSINCICPPHNPICICNHQATLKIINKKVIQPTPTEIKANPRSRSAKLRVAEKI